MNRHSPAMNRYNSAPVNGFATMVRDDGRGLWMESRDVERLLEKLMAMAGAKDPEAGCRAVIAECRKAMERNAGVLDSR